MSFGFFFKVDRPKERADDAGAYPRQVLCVHSTRVVFIPSKDKIRVRVPMDAHGGLLYMVAYNLRKVENRDRYPDPPLNCRYSIGAVPRLVAPVAPVRFRVAAFFFVFCLSKYFMFKFLYNTTSQQRFRLYSSVGRACA